ncbi:MAG: GPW/gp25 family protein [Sedimenticola sp.]
MPGMTNHSGKSTDGLAHLRQSIQDILTTPIGSRVMRRDYGSRLFELIDQPINPRTQLQLYAAGADALMRWEPRLRLHQIQLNVDSANPGKMTLSISGTAKTGTVELEVPIQ